MIPRGSPFSVPADSAKAAELAVRDAVRSRELWQQHGVTRQLLGRRVLAEQAKLLEARVVETANVLITRAQAGLGAR